MNKIISQWDILDIAYDKKNPGELRELYIDRLFALTPQEILLETKQMLLDIMDVLEQREEEKPVMAAYEAFEESVNKLK